MHQNCRIITFSSASLLLVHTAPPRSDSKGMDSVAFRLLLLGEVHMQKAILRQDLPIAAHLLAVEAATHRPATATSSLGELQSLVFFALTREESFVILVVADRLHAIKVIDHHGAILARRTYEAFVASLVLAVVDPSTDHRPGSHEEEEEADDHVTPGNEVVDEVVVAADAECLVKAGRVIDITYFSTLRDANHGHRNPA